MLAYIKNKYSGKLQVITSLLLLFLGNYISAQTTDSAYNNMQFHYGSPEAGATGKSTSVDLYTGTLSVNIPLGGYSGRQSSLPISIGYVADGVQVEELASTVGLGWNLSFGGRITSIVNGSPDGQTITGGTAQQCGFESSNNPAVRDRYVMEIAGAEREIFFMHGWVPKCLTNPLITADAHVSMSDQWVVLMPNGFTYYFGENGKNESSSTYSGSDAGCPPSTRTAYTSWLLTKIVSPDGLDVYRFEYNDFTFSTAIPNNGEGIARYGSNAWTKTALSSYTLKQQMITKVFHNESLVIEMTYKDRDDLKLSTSGSYTGNALDAILFYNFAPPYTTPTPYRKIVFNHSYFGMQAASTAQDFTKKRLKLDGITIVGIDGNVSENGDEYLFHYKDSPLGTSDFPDIASYAQDYSGLYNGKNQNTHLIPTLSGQQRAFALDYALTGTLEKITYPEKGYSVFEYEQNRIGGSYEIVEIPESINTIIHEVEIAKIEYTDEACQYVSNTFTDINENMSQLDFIVGGSTVTKLIDEVRTELLRMPAAGTINIGTAGSGIYLIQKLPSGVNCPTNQDTGCMPDTMVNPCLRPTDQIYYTGGPAANSSHPADFIAGGLTDYAYGYNGTPVAVPVPAGNYQITLWNDYTPNWNSPAKMRLFTTYTTLDTIPAHPETHDIPGSLTDGFRAKSISNYTEEGSDVAIKTEYRYGDSNYCSEINNTYVDPVIGAYRSSQGYTTGSNVLYYGYGCEFQTDGAETNGYIKYKFKTSTAYFANGKRDNYNVSLGSNGIVAGFWGFEFRTDALFDGRAIETETYSKHGRLLNKIIDRYSGFNYIYGYIDNNVLVPIYESFPYLAETERTEYLDSSELTTKTVYNYDVSFLCEGSTTTGPDGLVKDEVYLHDGVISNNTYSLRPTGSYDSDMTFHNEKVYTTLAGGRSFVTELKSGRSHLDLETKTKYEYDSDGNMVTKIAFTPGTLTPASYESTIYGYNNRIPMVKISGLKYSALDSTSIAQIKAKSNLPVTPANTTALLSDLKALRAWLRINHPMAKAVCSTYNAALMPATTTGMTEQTLYYEYDIQGRQTLTKKIDLSNEHVYIVSEKRYHTRLNSQDQNWIKEIIYKDSTEVPIANPTAAQATVALTYIDGLGRPVQQLAGQQSLDPQSGTYSDMSTFIEYDKFGRQTKQYLPYVTGTANFRFDATNAETLAFSDYANDSPFGENEFDGSPLNRVLKRSSPGNQTNWAMGSGHEQLFEYGTNDLSVRRLIYENGAVTDKGFYPKGTLYRSRTTDEDGNTMETYKNSKGLMVLQRKFYDPSNNFNYDTYYCYDVYDNLVFVAPPKIEGAPITANKIDKLCYQYHYDKYNRVVEKKLPSKQSEFIIYDKLNRIVMVGPAYHPMGADTATNTDRGWLMTYYDDLGRVAYTGWRQDNTISETTRATLQNVYNNAGIVSAKRSSAVTIDGTQVYYTDLTAGSVLLLTINYYDDYDFLPSGQINFSAPVANQPIYFNNTDGSKPLGMKTGSWVRVLIAGPTVGETTYSLFDKWGRAIGSYKTNYLGGSTNTETEINYAGAELNNTSQHKRTNSSVKLYQKDIFSYYDNGLTDKHTHQVWESPNSALVTELLSQHQYTKMGRLNLKNVGNDVSAPLQAISYQYNIRGWLTGINDLNDISNDPYFTFKINYDTVDDLIGDDVVPRYNGSIAETLWRSASDNIVRRYGYIYDAVNRMTQAVYNKVGANIPTNSYNEYIWYDSNGNLIYTERNGNLDDIGTTNAIDALIYSYNEDSNQLKAVYDDTQSTVGFKDNNNSDYEDTDYVYDLNGNLISDLNKGIAYIYYNHLNLPVEMRVGQSKIYYTYNAVGTKVKKVVLDAATGTTTTDYLDGYQYQNEKLRFFPTTEGYVSCTNTSGGTVFKYVYNYKDHLDNIRMSYTNENGGVKILEENHYYPYGLKHTNYNNSLKEWGNKETNPEEVVLKAPPVDPGGTIDQIYRYKFNSQEWQQELGLNVYDMDMRDYDPAIARWLNIDPVTHHTQSTYNAFDGNPVSIADPSGADGIVYGMAGQQAWSNPNPRGFFNYGNAVGLNVARERGNYDGHTWAKNSIGFWGSENSRQNDHGLHAEDIMTTTDPEEILNVLLNYGSYAANSESTGFNDDKVSTDSKVYGMLKGIGINDPNSAAPVDYKSIKKVLTSPQMQDIVKGANYQTGVNILIDFQSKSEKWYATTSPEDGNVYINGNTAFRTWARLAMTVAHEAVHKIDFTKKTWNPKSEVSTWKSEVKAWQLSETLGDPTGKQQRQMYQSWLDNR